MQIKLANLEQFGTFKCNTGVLRVADGCYNPNVWCIGWLTHVKTGEYLAFKITEKEEGCVSHIVIIHKSKYAALVEKKAKVLKLDCVLNETIGVDAGMAGFMDANHLTHEDKIYDKICDELGKEGDCYCDKSSAITTSGYGDGRYSCEYMTECENKNFNPLVVAAAIRFI